MARTLAAPAFALLGCAAPTPIGPETQDALGDHRGQATGCFVARVIDGDSVVMRCADDEDTAVRLAGYDSPEIFRPRCALLPQ